MNEELYEQLEQEFCKYLVNEEVEDILLELAEILADQGIIGREINDKEKYGNAMVEVCGICTLDEESGEEISVFLKWIKIEEKEFAVNDYLL